MPAGDVAAFLRTVQRPTVQFLLSGNLAPARAVADAMTPERDPRQWVALHIVVGAALRLRAPRMPPEERAVSCAEAVRALESALAVCCERKSPRGGRPVTIEVTPLSLKTGSSVPGPDGVQMVVDATSVPVPESISLLERAVRVLTDAATGVDRGTQLRAWVLARSNLGCALTLLGRRTPGMAGVQRIEQAIEAFREAAEACVGDDLQEELASIHVNLSDAFQALAERTLPGERLRHLEHSLDWIAAGLAFFAPEDYRWLLELEGAAVA